MPIVNPLIQAPNGTAGTSLFSGSAGSYDQSQGARRVSSNDGTPPVGTGGFTGSHNTPLHMAMFLIAALVVVFGLNMLGFGFSTVVKVGS